MSETSTGNGCGLWTAERSSLRVQYSRTVLEEIRQAAVDGCRRFRHGGIEIGGILLGCRENDVLHITACRPIPCEYAFGPSFVLSDKDRVLLEKALSEHEPGVEPAGWYQSHTRVEAVLTARDKEFFERYFLHPWQVALIVHPEPFGIARARFFVRGAGSNPVETSEEFELKPGTGLGTPPAGPGPDEVGPEVPPSDLPIPAAMPPARPRERGVPRWAWAFAAALGLLTLATFGWRHAPPAANPQSMALQVWEVGGQLRIEWDRNSEPVRAARGGVLEIEDGGSRVELPFDARRLKQGSVTYVRHSGEVEIRLRVFDPGRQPVEEFTRFIGQPPGLAEQPVPAIPAPFEAAGNSAAAASPPARSEPEAGPPRPPQAPEPENSRPAPQPSTVAAKFRMPPPVPQRSSSPLPLPAPPRITAQSEPVLPRTLPQTFEAPMPAAPREPQRPVYNGPATGRIIWTGQLPRGVALAIDGRHASTGFLNGELPGVAVRIAVYPAELSSKGLRVFTSDLQYVGGAEEGPAARNGWNKTVYTWNPSRAREVIVLEPPGQQNGWKRLSLRSDARQVGVVFIDWQVIR